MDREGSAARSAWRVAVVTIVTLIVGAYSLPDAVLPWYGPADFGLRFDNANNVLSVDPESSADRAGVRAGDRVDAGATPVESRGYLGTGFIGAMNGAKATFVIQHGGAERRVVLVAHTRARSFADNATDLLLVATYASIFIVCGALVVLRPSKMTWAFFFYGCGVPTASVLFVALVPGWISVAYSATVGTLQNLAWVPFSVFALRFPNDLATGWRQVAQRVVLWSLVVLVPLSIWSSIGGQLDLPQFVEDVTRFLGYGIVFLAIAGFAFVALTLAITYVHAGAPDRARLRWVIVGLLVGELGNYMFNVLPAVPGVTFAPPIWATNLLLSAQIMVPITVAYAIIRHRVFDVRFVVGRAVVYALLTSTLVVFVALLDFLVGRLLSQSHLATIAEVIASIAIGLSLNGLHKRLEGIVDRTLFRSRRLAELRLRRIGRGLIHAGSAQAITHVLVSEPHAAYGLASAALFTRSSDDFERNEAIGWEHARLQTLKQSASIVLQLQAEQKPVAAHAATWEAGDLPHGLESPAFVLPIFVGGRMEAIAFYGPHLSGEDLDPEELDVLDELMRAAGSAYDHAAAEIARERLQFLEAENSALRGLVTADAQPFITSRTASPRSPA